MLINLIIFNLINIIKFRYLNHISALIYYLIKYNKLYCEKIV